VIECAVVNGAAQYTFDGTINNPNGLEIISVSHEDGVVSNEAFTFSVTYKDNLGEQKTATANIAASEDCTPPTTPNPSVIVNTNVPCDATSTTAVLKNTGDAEAIFTYEIGENVPPIGTALAVIRVAPGTSETITIPLTPGKVTPVVINSEGMETVSVQLKSDECPPPTPVCDSTSPSWNAATGTCELPHTGGSAQLALWGAGLILAGLALLDATKKRLLLMPLRAGYKLFR
jgi:hypothetical protein